MAVVWTVVVAVGVGVAVFASRRGIDLAVAVAAAWGAPPLAIGVTLIAIGTDIPEIANSVVAAIGGHGDVNVGTATGSAATQSTLVLGLLPWVAAPILVGARRVLTVSTVTVIALVVGAALVADGDLSRLDGAALIGLWLGGTLLVWRQAPPPDQAELPLAAAHPWRDGAAALAWFGLVAVGATVAVAGLEQLSAVLGIPEYVMSFSLLALGTSLPELVVDITAVRRGQPDLAIGDALGSSMVDSTLSVGLGPLVAPTLVTAGTAVRGALGTAAALALVGVFLTWRQRLGRGGGTVLIVLYVALYAILLSGAG